MAPTTETAPATTTEAPLEGAALKDAIKRQAEYYFSQQNLSSDTYLLSLMDSEFYVPLSVIANFGKLKALTSDVSLITEVLKESDQVVLDESASKVRPKAQQKRSTLILRDIPTETPLEEINALFKGSKTPSNIRPDVLNTWFLSFESEEDTMAALEFLRKGVQFQGKPVRCAIKSESVIKSIYYADARTQQAPQIYTDPASYGAGGRQWGNRRPGNNAGPAGNNGGRRGGAGGGRGQDFTGGRAATTTGANTGAATTGAGGNQGGGRGKGQRRPRGKEGGAGDVQTTGSKVAAPQQSQVVLSPIHFPPLPSKGNEKMGYIKDFKRYTREEFVEIIRATIPTKIDGIDQQCVVLLSNPDLNLETDKSEEERDRRVSMEFDLSHLAKQAIAAVAAHPPATVKEETEAEKQEESSSKEPTPVPKESSGVAPSPSKVSYAAMASKPKS